jgi:Tol biopolymer transport system component
VHVRSSLPVVAVGLGLLAPPGATAAPQLAVTRVGATSTRLAVLELGGAARALTAGPADADPAWSPGGTRIALTRNGAIVVIRSSGGGARRLAAGERPAWSPGGRWIAYQGTDGIRLVRPGGGATRRVPGTSGAAWPAWTPSGTRLAFTQGGHIVTARTDGTARRRVVRGREPAYTPDGQTLVFTGPDGGIRSVPSSGGTVRELHAGMQPDVSAGGDRIAFTRWPASGRFSVWVMALDGSGAREVLGDARDPAWRPGPAAAGTGRATS